MKVETANRIAAALRIHDEYEAMHAAAQQLVRIVEGVSEPHGGWRSKQRCGLRLKDTPEWALFYGAFKDTEAKSSNKSANEAGMNYFREDYRAEPVVTRVVPLIIP